MNEAHEDAQYMNPEGVPIEIQESGLPETALAPSEKKLLREGWTLEQITLAREGWERREVELLNSKGDIKIDHQMVKPYVEEYYKVVFSEKGDPRDTDDVHLICNGETLLLQRGVPVVVPKRFLETADHGTHDVYQQLPGLPRKKLYKVQTYRYTIIEKGFSREDYLRMKAGGDAIAAAERQRAETVAIKR